MLQGIDVSSYQSATPDVRGLDFVFIKVTEGLSYVNPEWQSQATDARTAGCLVGLYHYPHIANSATAEASYFLRQIGSSLQPGDVLILDWEWYGQSVTDQQARDYKTAFLAELKSSRPAHRRVLYCDRSTWTGVDTDSNAGDGLWIADYTIAGHPRITAQWAFHQYTDVAPQGGDGDVANPNLFPNAAALHSWAGTLEPTPAPSPTPTPPQESDMPQQIVGMVVPGSQPTVVLPPCGTAWAAYPNRRLHLGMDQIGDPTASAEVRVAVHDGTKWGSVTTVKVIAAGSRIDIDMTPSDVKVSLQTDSTGVSYAIEIW